MKEIDRIKQTYPNVQFNLSNDIKNLYFAHWNQGNNNNKLVENITKPGDIPWNPYAPPPPGADPAKYQVKQAGDIPWNPYAPPPPGAEVQKPGFKG